MPASDVERREMLDAGLHQAVLQRDNAECDVCGYAVRPALRVHHVIPVSLGGIDVLDNLVLLCSNCHALVHHLSSERFGGGDSDDILLSVIDADQSRRLSSLVKNITSAKSAITKNAQGWSAGHNTRDAYGRHDAIDLVARHAEYDDSTRHIFDRAFGLVSSHIPASVLSRCSFRLLGRGRYISINVMNYLIWRSPAYRDLGGVLPYDCLLILGGPWEDRFSEYGDSIAFRFKNFDAVSVGLSFSDILEMQSSDWSAFQSGCELAANARRSRSWVSNIKLARPGPN